MVNKATEPLLNTDAYKLDHRRQYPEGITRVFSNFTNRGTRIDGVEEVVQFGLQAFLVDLQKSFDEFFAGDIDEIAEEYTKIVTSILGPNTIGDEHIRELHALGYLPLEFDAVPEGVSVPLRVPSFTITNTHDNFYWLVNYLETWISTAVWQPSTSATIAKRFRKLLVDSALRTDKDNVEFVDFQGHDFSMRGMAGIEAGAASGAAHLTAFQGSDTLSTHTWIDEHYGDHGSTEKGWHQDFSGWVLGSVPATEHSVMCAGGSDEGEEQHTYERLLGLYPEGIVSVVSDTWDLWNVLTNILPNLHDKIMARNGKLVVRPDSGDPVDILTGTAETMWSKIKDRSALSPEEKGVIELLWDEFGGTTNEQGFKVLDPHVGTIYGDSINYERAKNIIERLEAKGFASTNVVFGMGSYTYQYQTRDTFQSAIKATYVIINGEGKAISKNPVTDSGMKKSASGLLAVLKDSEGRMYLKDNLSELEWVELSDSDVLQPVWRNGKFQRWFTFDEVRANVRS